MIDHIRPQIAAIKEGAALNAKREELANLLLQDFSDHIDVSNLGTPRGVIEEAILMLEQMTLMMP